MRRTFFVLFRLRDQQQQGLYVRACALHHQNLVLRAGAAVAAIIGLCAAFAPAKAATEKVLHVFGAGADGNSPGENLIEVNGTLYGTTWFGGTSNNVRCNGYGCGTVFKIDPATGDEKVIYSFGGHSDGAYPSSLISINGELYGTTEEDGDIKPPACGGRGCGTVFSVTPSGTLTTLHRFKGGGAANDGEFPYPGLLNVKGTLYGTTYQGGQYGAGNVFEIALSGKDKTLHSFSGNPDGANPYAGLIDVKGMLFGTTEDGGYGIGTVFSLNPKTGAENVLYSFCGGQTCTDGYLPDGNLLNVNGTLFGTTVNGGTDGAGHGVVFSITQNGNFNVVHTFQGGSSDGSAPESGLIEVNGILYGTTVGGGSTGCVNAAGCGTVYSIDPSTGAEKVVYKFQSGTDGSYPWASLIYVNGTFYGVTETGGGSGPKCVYDQGCGTVFSLTL